MLDPDIANLVAQPNVPETVPDNRGSRVGQSNTLGVPPIASGLEDDLPDPKPQASGDYRFYRSKDLLDISTGSSLQSSTNEPNLDARGDAHFMTGNWYAAFATDYGQYYRFVDPFTTFPASDGGFCCDQLVIYDDSRDLMFWLLQYIESGGTNRQRLAVIHGSDLNPGMTGADWTYYDFTAASFGLGSNRWLDYPKMALSNNYLYINSNVYDTSDSWTNSAAWRIPLNQLNAGGTINFNYFTRDDTASIMPTDGATTTMYWGTHNSLSQVRIYRWAENSSSLFWDNVNISSWTAGSFSCLSPDGNNACGRIDGRMLGGWVANNVIGFMWGSNADGSTYSYPYVNVARFNQSNRSLIDQPRLWSNSTAWIYPSIGVNNRGHIAGPVFTVGGGSYPTLRIIVADDYSGTPPPWENYFVRASTHGPERNRWGDYVSSRRHEQYANTWVSSGFTLQGGSGNGSTHPQIIWHGRERDQPPAWPSNDDITNSAFAITSPSNWTQSTTQATSAVDDPTATCGSSSTPWQSRSVWYSFIPSTSGNYEISTNGSNYDTVLAVWRGSRGSLIQVGCDDDGGTGTQSSLVVALNSGTKYYIEAMRYGFGTGGELALSLKNAPPSPPANVQASDSTFTDKVRVTWSSVTNATSYEVWRNTTDNSGTASQIAASVSGTSYDDTSAVAGQIYYYWVKAKNSYGSSAFSASDSGTVKPVQNPPAVPTNVQASDKTFTDKIRVTWNTVVGATSYQVYRAGSETGTKTNLGTTTSPTYNDTTASLGFIYYYFIKACDGDLCSDFGGPDSGTVGVHVYLPVVTK
ncbi:MAG: hypothetical protein KDI79_05820 [Anaerolineae bacterium]|nr:hypothetical protein [Anaerolineae bacterium]